MKILNRRKITEQRGQAILEFALIAPLLFLVLFGLIEVGRLIFMYGSIVTASREAVRYGSTEGIIEAGSDHFRYQDCDGIRESAEKVAFLTDPADLTVAIGYDYGPGTTIDDTCVETNGAGIDENVDVSPDVDGNRRRIVVTVSAPYAPILPLVPFTSYNIETSSARTYLGVVEYWPE